MSDTSELDQLEQRVEKARAMVRRSEIKIEELEASRREIYNFKDRLVLFRQVKRKLPVSAR